MNKVTYLTDLYKKSVKELTKQQSEWKGLLETMSRFYNRSFDNIVLIHVQNPNVTQLATFDEWHLESVNRSVNKGAKGIAVIDLSNPSASLKYYFDLLDTNGTHESFKRVIEHMWELEDQYKSSVLIKLHNRYGVSTDTIESTIYELSVQKVEEILGSRIAEYSITDKKSKLHQKNIEEVRKDLKQFIIDSTYYMIANRMNLNKEYLAENSFEQVKEYGELELFVNIGVSTMMIARPILKEIHEVIQSIKLERSALYEQRSIGEINLQGGRGRTALSRLSHSGEGTQGIGGEIRSDVERVHDGETSTENDDVSDEGANQSKDFTSGQGDGTKEREFDSRTSESTAISQNGESTREGSPHEHDLQNSRGDTNRGSVVHPVIQIEDSSKKSSLDDFFVLPRIEKEQSREEHRDMSYDLDEEEVSDLIDTFLVSDNFDYDVMEWQSEIYRFMIEDKHSKEDKRNVIKSFYKALDTSYTTEFGDYLEIVKGSESGVHFERGGQPFFVSYEEMVERIEHLIKNGVYPYSTEEELDEYDIPDEVEERKRTVRENLVETGDLVRDDIITNCLLLGTGKIGSKGSIQNAILKMERSQEREYFIKEEYGWSGFSETGGGVHKSIRTDENGLLLGYKTKTSTFEELIEWSEVSSRIYKMSLNNEYILSSDEEDKQVLLEEKSEEEMIEQTKLVLVPFRKVEREDVRREEFEIAEELETEDIEQLDFFSNKNEIEEPITIMNDQDGFLESMEVENPKLSIGTRVSYEGRVFEILDYLYDGKTVELGEVAQSKDVDTFLPRQRVPKTILENCEVLELDKFQTPNSQPAPNMNNNMELLEELHEDSLNYRYRKEHNLYEGGAKTKCKANIEAITLLKQLEEVGQHATIEEQIILAKYVGWGGLANALTPNKEGWGEEYRALKQLLTEEEFESAQKSTMTAYYTEQGIIENIYKALYRFGFRSGNILDPAMGVGNFYSVLPETMNASELYGVELDSITGRIAKALYPTAHIEVKGFEETTYPDQFFDVAIGNIPFNNIQIRDTRYDKHNFKIHDYFLAKSLDKLRSGGIMVFITSKGTMDKSNQKLRKYIAQRAELVGAIRLPNTAFMQVAGSQVTSDILFFKKREREIVPSEENTPWLAVSKDEHEIPMNQYFIDHPEMILGEMVFDESMYGSEKTTACHPLPNDNLLERLEQSIHYLDGTYEEATSEFADDKESLAESITASPYVKNFSYTLVNDKIYYRENARMYLQEITGKKAERIKGMIQIHGDIQSLVNYQSDRFIQETTAIEVYQEKIAELIRMLNVHYDGFLKEFGYINAPANVSAFQKDGAAPLLRSIEEESREEKGVYEKTAIFSKPTIHKKELPKAVYEVEEALKVCMNTKGRVDLGYMAEIYAKPSSETGWATQEVIIEELGDKLYQDPELMGGDDQFGGYVLAEEYLSGYVKEKLQAVLVKAYEDPTRWQKNIEALESVQPPPLEPHAIQFSIGTTWIPKDVYQSFMYEVFETNEHYQGSAYGINVEFSEYTGSYHISNKGYEYGSVAVNTTYGTKRKNAYEILEDTLNLKKVEVRDPEEYQDQYGEKKKRYVVNKVETLLAREKQSIMEQTFQDWLFTEPKRREKMKNLYNDLMNNVVVRRYHGDDLLFPDMNGEITLRSHQKDVIAHGLYGGGNLLMAHEVGAGKTYSAIALTYELKRMGVANKPLITVPNHLVGQWATAYMELYPTANILVAGKKDFEKANRRRFASRIAVGDYDAVIMAHSSFELIGLSKEYQLELIGEEIDEIKNAIASAKLERNDKWSLKQMQIFQKNLEVRYEKLLNVEKKDTVISFEQLGVDCLVVDESHMYKNNFSYTKLRNVAGIGSSSSQRAMDMHMKAQYINKINDGKGVIYLTGTPIANSMSELYVIQKTLQPNELAKRKQLLFDSWASAYGEITSSLEIKPEGNGYQMKSRFAKFHNIPELMKMFRMVADIRTSEMLEEIPKPKLKNNQYTVIKTGATPDQKEMIVQNGERAENIRNRRVDSEVDNFLKLTMESRLLSTDPRILNPLLPNDPDYKLNVCARKVAQIYQETEKEKLTQIIFCDQGTPKDDGSFSFYDATKEELIAQGVKAEEIAFIHEANTELQKEQLFEKIRSGEVRILMGSTSKMGTGMNVQDKLIALHHLDIPWRPSDLVQRNGRILRQGNKNPEVEIFNYITEDTFDSYLWQILEQKQRYSSQIMRGDTTIREIEDLDEMVLQYAEFKALAISDPHIKEKMEVDNELTKLTILKSSYESNLISLQEKVNTYYPNELTRTTNRMEQMKKDIFMLEQNNPSEFQMEIRGRVYTERAKAAEHFKVISNKLGYHVRDCVGVGTYRGFSISVVREIDGSKKLMMEGAKNYEVELGESELGAITRLENAVEKIPTLRVEEEEKFENLYKQYQATKEELAKSFPQEERLKELQARKVELDLALEFGEFGKGDTVEEKLHETIYPYIQKVVEQEAYYVKYESNGYEDLVIEKVGEEEYSIAHYYLKNGDMMRDPELTFAVENNGIVPITFLQDDMGVYYRVEDVSKEIVEDLKEFLSIWFSNITSQGYEEKTIYYYEQEEECDQDEEQER